MPFIAPELIIQAKQMDLLTYLKNYEPYELVKYSGNTYCTRTHDSLKISNGKWIWWSRGIGGRSALDYLIKVKGYSFLEAVETIIGHTAIQAPVYEKPQPKEENKPLLLPEKCASNIVITEYLFGRGIDFEIINYCISNDLIFESLPYHNVVFVGYDEKKEPKYAAYYEFSANDELVITKGHNNFTPKEEAKSFHADTYCFDSKPEKECFLQYISSNKVKEIYFTGMFTSNQGDLSVQYYDPESKRLRKYYPDFLALMEDGSYQLIEVKGDNKIDDEVVLAKKAAAEEMAVASGIHYLMYAGSTLMKSNVLEPTLVVQQASTDRSISQSYLFRLGVWL